MVLPVAVARVVIVSLLFLGSGLAGCSNKDSGDTEDPESFLDPRTGRTLPPGDPGHTIDPTRLSECEDCIPLDFVPQRPTPARPVPVSIPFPQVGDRAEVVGKAHEWGKPPAWVPETIHGRYDLSFQVEAGDTSARFVFVPDHPAPPDDRTHVTVDTVAFEVSLTSRLVQGGEQVGTVRVHGPLHHDELRHAVVEIRPELETLFWLGSHVWGRDLVTGDRFSTRWTVDGTGGEMVHFEYRVHRAEPDGIVLFGDYRPFGTFGPVARSTPHMTTTHAHAEIHLTYTDVDGRQAQWGLVFREDSPYPILIRSDADTDGPYSMRKTPGMAFDQEVRLIDRGDAPLDWSAAVLRSPATERDDHQVYRLGERLAPRPLDDLAAYPLRSALADLDLLEGSYREFVARSPDRVLVAAEYTVSPLPIGERHEWYVVFTDRDDGAFGWMASRIGTEDGVLVPERQGAAIGRGVEVIRILAEAHGDTGALGIGDALTEAFREIGVEQVDRLYYSLEPRGTDRIGGTLTGIADRIPWSNGLGPLALEDSVHPLGFFTLDLGTQRLTAGGPFVPYGDITEDGTT